MNVYVGQTRSRSLITELQQLGWGESTQRNELPPRRRPWFLDNGAFKDWRAGRVFNESEFRSALSKVAAEEPDFVVCPDRVAAGGESLALSERWLPEIRVACSAPVYLVLQDGMCTAAVAAAVRQFDGVFVGGTLKWKLRSGQDWIALATRWGVPCHIGRVGTARRVRWAKRIGASSIDSTVPLWSRENLRAFRRALEDRQLDLFEQQDQNAAE